MAANPEADRAFFRDVLGLRGVDAGGGFMIFYCPGNAKYTVMQKLEKFGGQHRNYQFTEHGLKTWTI